MADTIAAISTAPGEAGIGIVRVSGPGSLDTMRKVMEKSPADIEPRHMYLAGAVKDFPGAQPVSLGARVGTAQAAVIAVIPAPAAEFDQAS